MLDLGTTVTVVETDVYYSGEALIRIPFGFGAKSYFAGRFGYPPLESTGGSLVTDLLQLFNG